MEMYHQPFVEKFKQVQLINTVKDTKLISEAFVKALSDVDCFYPFRQKYPVQNNIYINNRHVKSFSISVQNDSYDNSCNTGLGVNIEYINGETWEDNCSWDTDDLCFFLNFDSDILFLISSELIPFINRYYEYLEQFKKYEQCTIESNKQLPQFQPREQE